jgi:hypothetical protein
MGVFALWAALRSVWLQRPVATQRKSVLNALTKFAADHFQEKP